MFGLGRKPEEAWCGCQTGPCGESAGADFEKCSEPVCFSLSAFGWKDSQVWTHEGASHLRRSPWQDASAVLVSVEFGSQKLRGFKRLPAGRRFPVTGFQLLESCRRCEQASDYWRQDGGTAYLAGGGTAVRESLGSGLDRSAEETKFGDFKRSRRECEDDETGVWS